jgi:hypothetical protein
LIAIEKLLFSIASIDPWGDRVPLENLTITRMCLHEVYRRGDDGNVVPPTYGTGLLKLHGKALDVFRARVVSAFNSEARCMEMSIRQYSTGSAFEVGSSLNNVTDEEFILTSRHFADSLAAFQTSRTIPGGIVVVFDGTVGFPATNFFAVMKAELHEGFLKTKDMQAQFVNDLFLSPKTKLYKIGIFVSLQNPNSTLPSGWKPIVYDNSMTASQRDAAATYFYSSFLGLDIPVNSAHQVVKFFESTKIYISRSSLDQESKVDLYNSLYSYLKVDQGNTIQVSEFANRYMSADLADDYERHMERERVPTTAVVKDLSEVRGSLRLRRFKFPRAITLSGPPDAVRDLVVVSPLRSESGEEWTEVKIRGRIESQE